MPNIMVLITLRLNLHDNSWHSQARLSPIFVDRLSAIIVDDSHSPSKSRQ